MKTQLLKRVDRFLGKVAARLFPTTDNHRLPPLQRLAVVRLWAIGEGLLALPALAALKQQWPETILTVITTPRVAEIFEGQDFIDEVLIIRPNIFSFIHFLGKNRKRFDVVIDFEPYFYVSALLAKMVGKYSLGFNTLTRGRIYSRAVPYRDDQHVVKTNFDLVRAVGALSEIPAGPVGSFTPTRRASAAFRAAGRGTPLPPPAASENVTIAFAPGGGVDFRRWPAERFAKAADYLQEKYHAEILLVGDKTDVPILEEVQKNMKNSAQIVSGLSLAEVASLLSSCRLTIANDGGLMHLSASVDTPTLGLFGPETPVRMGPYGPNNRALYHQLEDNPIINVSRGEVPGMLSVIGDLSRYVRAITVEEVISASTSLMEMARIS